MLNTISLQEFTEKDITDEYVAWLNDPEVNKFLECRYEYSTYDTVYRYFTSLEKSNSKLFKIIYIENNTHIGNIRLGPIDPKHLNAEIGYLIGNKNYWNMSIGAQAIELIIKIAVEIGLKKLTAGCYENNIGSISVLVKNGFRIEGFRHNYVNFESKRIGAYIFGRDL